MFYQMSVSHDERDFWICLISFCISNIQDVRVDSRDDIFLEMSYNIIQLNLQRTFKYCTGIIPLYMIWIITNYLGKHNKLKAHTNIYKCFLSFKFSIYFLCNVRKFCQPARAPILVLVNNNNNNHNNACWTTVWWFHNNV